MMVLVCGDVLVARVHHSDRAIQVMTNPRAVVFLFSPFFHSARELSLSFAYASPPICEIELTVFSASSMDTSCACLLYKSMH